MLDDRHRDPRRPPAQPQGHRRRRSEAPARGFHRRERQRQVFARVRHDLHRGVAPARGHVQTRSRRSSFAALIANRRTRRAYGRARAAERRVRVAEDDEALRPDRRHDQRRRYRAHRDLKGSPRSLVHQDPDILAPTLHVPRPVVSLSHRRRSSVPSARDAVPPCRIAVHPAGPGVPSALGAVPSAIGLSLGWTRAAIGLSLPRRDGPGGVSMSTGRPDRW